jgi:plasmid stabilization system protein ParE
MSRELRVSSLAEKDLAEVFEWYKRRSAGLGTEFIKYVDATVLLVQRSPLIFRKRVGEYRLAMTPRFPYAVYFIFDEIRDIVSIRRVLHFSQDRVVHLQKA